MDRKVGLGRNKLIVILAAFTMLCGCVEFKQITLYDGMEPEPQKPKPVAIGMVVEPEIYSDDPRDMWGIEETVCKKAEFSYDEVYSGKQAVKISWNRYAEGCEFAGIGIGWDNWAGKDLTDVMDHCAIQFYVRAQEELMYGLPIVLTLIDYSGGMGFAYTGNKWFERTFIDTTWQKIVVPLSAFDLETENLDVSNIKQLQLELQQNGSIYLDEIDLVFFEEPVVEPWYEEEALDDPLAMPKTIFGDEFINGHGWGMVDWNCRTIEIAEGEAKKGKKAISAKWDDSGECDAMFIAASWNKWHPVDFTVGNYEDFAFEFYIYNRGEATAELNLNFGLSDYNRNYISTRITGKFADKDIFNQSWTRVYIPITELKGYSFDYKNVKQLGFQLINSGDLLIDELRMVRRNEN